MSLISRNTYRITTTMSVRHTKSHIHTNKFTHAQSHIESHTLYKVTQTSKKYTSTRTKSQNKSYTYKIQSHRHKITHTESATQINHSCILEHILKKLEAVHFTRKCQHILLYLKRKLNRFKGESLVRNLTTLGI